MKITPLLGMVFVVGVGVCMLFSLFLVPLSLVDDDDCPPLVDQTPKPTPNQHLTLSLFPPQSSFAIVLMTRRRVDVFLCFVVVVVVAAKFVDAVTFHLVRLALSLLLAEQFKWLISGFLLRAAQLKSL